MSIDKYQNLLPSSREGSCWDSPHQVEALSSLIDSSSISFGLEIGFNAGHSADLFLSQNKNLKLISFDLGEHDYVSNGKYYIDNTYPFRHRLILGDSRVTIPNFIKDNPGLKIDFFFIDGDHTKEGAMADINNCMPLATERSLVVLDDTRTKGDCTGAVPSWAKGPHDAWNECVRQGIIKETGSVDFPQPNGLADDVRIWSVKTKEIKDEEGKSRQVHTLNIPTSAYKGHSWGRYILS